MDRFNGGHRRLLACVCTAVWTTRMSRAEPTRSAADEPSGGFALCCAGHADAAGSDFPGPDTVCDFPETLVAGSHPRWHCTVPACSRNPCGQPLPALPVPAGSASAARLAAMGSAAAISLAVVPADRRIAETGGAAGGAAVTPGVALLCWCTIGIRTHPVTPARLPAEAGEGDWRPPCGPAGVPEVPADVPEVPADVPGVPEDRAALAAGVMRAHAWAAACSAAVPT
jgi:hypothetical protein